MTLRPNAFLWLAVGSLWLALSDPAQARPTEPKPVEPLSVVIIFDTSGSMQQPVQGRPKLDIAKAAVGRFIDLLPPGAETGLVTFLPGCRVRTAQGLGPATPSSRAALKSELMSVAADGQTPIGAALLEATNLLINRPGRRRVVILTDGEETCDIGTLRAAADQAWKEGIRVFAVGFAFGEEPSENFRRLGIYKDANDEKQLASVFAEISKSLEKGRFDERDAASAERPIPSLEGRTGHFRPGGTGRLLKTLQPDDFFDQSFGALDRFTVLEHGYHIAFDETNYRSRRVEILRVRMLEREGSLYGGAEGFVFLDDSEME